MKYLLSLSGVIVLFLSVSCKKEKTTWQANWNTPLVYGNLTISDLVSDENTMENGDNYASLVFHDTVYSFSIDTLIKLPDTTLVQKAVSSFNLTLGPGNLIQSVGVDQLYDLGQIELKRVMVKEGTAIITIESPFPGKTKVQFSFPKTLDGNGDIFAKEYILPAGTLANPSIVSETISMKDFDFDLTGTDGSLVNYITADAFIISAEETDYFQITNQDTVIITMEFKDMTPKYAKGYFGEYLITDTTSISIAQMKKVIGGNILLDSLNLNLSVRNGFKLFAQATFNQLKGINSGTFNEVELIFPNLNSSININPASGGLYDYVASSFSLPINNSNSNILAFIENLPDSIDIGYTIHINPYGNTTGGDDEFFPNSVMDIYLDGEFPLKFSADAINLVDNFDLSFTQNENARVNKGIITLRYENSFPIETIATIALLDGEGNTLETLSPSSGITSGTYNALNGTTTPSSGDATYTLTEETLNNLELTKQIEVNIKFSTDESAMVKININDYFKFNLFSDLNLHFNL
jgi:hypothetical protein